MTSPRYVKINRYVFMILRNIYIDLLQIIFDEINDWNNPKCGNKLSFDFCLWNSRCTILLHLVLIYNTTQGRRAPKPGKTPIMAARRCCRRRLLFFKIKVRPRPCQPYRVRRRCLTSYSKYVISTPIGL